MKEINYELLYETPSFDEKSIFEIALFIYRGKKLYREDNLEGTKCKIRTAPRKFSVPIDLSDPDFAGVLYWNSEKGYCLLKPDFEVKKDVLILDLEKSVQKGRTAAGQTTGKEELLRYLEPLNENYITYHFEKNGYCRHMEENGGDWGLDTMLLCYKQNTFFLEDRPVIKILVRSHWDLNERGDAGLLQSTLKEKCWSKEQFEAWVDTLDTYDSYVMVVWQDEDNETKTGSIRLDGGKRKVFGEL